jgi:hypothetical protein
VERPEAGDVGGPSMGELAADRSRGGGAGGDGGGVVHGDDGGRRHRRGEGWRCELQAQSRGSKARSGWGAALLAARGRRMAGDGALAAGSRGRARTSGRRTLQGTNGRGARLLGAERARCPARRGRVRSLLSLARTGAGSALHGGVPGGGRAGAAGSRGGRRAGEVDWWLGVGRGAGGWGPAAAAAGERRERSRRLGRRRLLQGRGGRGAGDCRGEEAPGGCRTGNPKPRLMIPCWNANLNPKQG